MAIYKSAFDQAGERKNKYVSAFDQAGERKKEAKAQEVGEQITNRLSTWLKNNETYVNNYNYRYSGDNSAYRADSADWLSTITTQKNNFDAESQSIMALADEYKDYFSEDFYNGIKSALYDNSAIQSKIVESATKDNEFWTQFESEQKYNEWVFEEEKKTADLPELGLELDAYKQMQTLLTEIANIEREVNNPTGRYAKQGYSIAELKEQLSKKRSIFDNMANSWWDTEKDGKIDIVKLDDAVAEKQEYFDSATKIQEKESIVNTAKNAADFEEFAAKGAAIENPSFEDAQDWKIGPFTLKEGKTINNPVKFSKENVNADAIAGEINGSAQAYENYNINGWAAQYMKDEAVKIYNYYLGKGDVETAEKYLEMLQEDFVYRHNKGIFEEMKGSPVEEYVFKAIVSATDAVGNMMNAGAGLVGADPVWENTVALTDKWAREDLKTNYGNLATFGYDATGTVSAMLPSVLGSFATGNPAVGAVMMGASAGGSAYAEMLDLGYDKGQAQAYGIMIGASEVLLERLLGGISALGGNSGGLTKAMLSKIDKAIGRVAVQLGGSMVSEGLEEGIQTVLEPWIKSVVTKEDFEAPGIDEVLYASLLGAVTSLVFEGGDIALQTGNSIALGREVKKQNGAVEKLVSLGKTLDQNSAAYRIANKVNEKTGAYTIGRLYQEVGATVSEQNLQDIITSLESKGMNSKDAQKLARVYQAMVNDDVKLSDSQKRALENNTVLSGVLRNNVIGPNTTVYQRTKSFYGVTEESNSATNTETSGIDISKVIRKLPSMSELSHELNSDENFSDVSAGIMNRARYGESSVVGRELSDIESAKKKSINVADKYTASKDGKARLKKTGETVEVVDVMSTKDGSMKVKLKDGSVVDAGDVAYRSADEALVYEAVANMGVNPATAWSLIKEFDPVRNSGIDYAMGISEVYNYGKYNFGLSEIKMNGYASVLSRGQFNKAYKLGRVAAEFDAKNRQAKINEAKDRAAKADNKGSDNKGKTSGEKDARIYYDKSVDRENLSERQKMQIDTLAKFAENFGVKIHFFQSKADSKGHAEFEMPDGTLTGSNGWYDPTTGEIWLDVRAGADYSGKIIYTASHELTHFIRDWSPAKFKVFADFLIKQYGKKGEPVSALVEAQRLNAAEQGRKISFDEAYEEVVADSCERFLLDSNAVEVIAQLKNKDKGLVQKIHEFFDNMLNKLRAFIKSEHLEADSREAKLVSEMEGSIKKLHKLWTDALVDAGESYAAVGGKVDSSATDDVKASKRKSFDEQKKNRASATSPLTRRSVEQRSLNSAHIKMPSAAAAEMLGIENISQCSDDVKEAVAVLGEFYKSVEKNKPVLGFKKPATASNLEGMMVAMGILKREGGGDSAYRYENGHGLRLSNHSADANNFKGEGEHLSLALFEKGKMNDFVEGKSNVIEARFRKWYLDSHPEVFKCVIHDIAHFIVEGEYHDTAGAIEPYKFSGTESFIESAKQRLETDRNERAEKYKHQARARDAEYMTAVENGDIEAAQRMVDEAAERAFASSKIRDEDGRLLKVYHGTDIEFTVFDKSKGRSNMDIQGMFFSPWEIDARGYGSNVKAFYLNIVNPASESVGYRALNKYKGQNNAGIKARESLISMGYDGVNNENEEYVAFDSSQIKSADPITYDDNGDVIPLSERFNTTKEDIRFQSRGKSDYYTITYSDKTKKNFKPSDRPASAVSDRVKLANALKSAVSNEAELMRVNEYIDKIGKMDEQEKKLNELNAEIKDLSFAKGPRDKDKLLNLRIEATKTKNRIDLYDKQLLKLESTAALKRVLEHEKVKAYKKAQEKGKQKLQDYKAVMKQKEADFAAEKQKIRDRYNERLAKKDSKIEAIKVQNEEAKARERERRSKTAVKKDIRKTVAEIRKILVRGNKKRNVKQDMQDFVSEALHTADVLFANDFTNAELILNGIGTELSQRESEIVSECLSLLNEQAVYDEQGNTVESEKIKNRLSAKMSQITEVFVRERARINKMPVSTALDALSTAYRALANAEQSAVQGAYDENVAAFMDSLKEDIKSTVVKDMSLSQLEKVEQAYKMVYATIRNANKVFAENLSGTRTELGETAMREIRAVGGEKYLRAKDMLAINKFGWDNLKPVYAFEMIGSPVLNTLYDNVRKGEDVWMRDVSDAKAFFSDVSSKYNYDHWDFKQTFSFKSTTGIPFDLDLQQVMSLYAYSKREQAHKHLMQGGFVFGTDTEVQKGLVTYVKETAKAHNLSMETFAEIVSKLTPEQKAFVDEMQNYLSSVMGEKGNFVSMAMYGVRLFNEEHYFPLKSAGQYNQKAKEMELQKNEGKKRLVNSGFSKETVKNANNPVVLDSFMDVWCDHVSEMSMYHGFVLPLNDLQKVYSYKTSTDETSETISVDSVIQNAYGRGATSYINNFIDDVNGGVRSNDTMKGVTDALIGKFKKASVFASLSVMIQQPSAIGRAFAYIDPKYFVGKPSIKGHKDTWAKVKKYAPVAQIKEMGYFDTHMGMQTKDWIQAKNFKGLGEMFKKKDFSDVGNRIAAFFNVKDSNYRDELFSRLPALMDELTWCEIWKATEREIADTTKLKRGTEAFYNAVGERFSEVVTKTQVYDSVMSRSAHMRSKNTFNKMATAFMAEPTTAVNMLVSSIVNAKRGNKKFAGRIVASVVTATILNSLLKALPYALRDDDEDEAFAEKYLESFMSDLVNGVNVFTYIPLVKDVWSIVQGYDVERSDMSMVTELWNSIEAFFSDSKSGPEKAEAFAFSVLDLMGFPAANVKRDVKSIIDYLTNDWKAVSARGLGRAALSGIIDASPSFVDKITDFSKNAKVDKLYDAYINGDAEYRKKIESRYSSKTAYETALKNALIDNDDRIQQAAKAQSEGNTEERIRICKEIVAEGNFSQDIVVKAVNTVANEKLLGYVDKLKRTDSRVKSAAEAVIAEDEDLAESIMAEIESEGKYRYGIIEDAVEAMVDELTPDVELDESYYEVEDINTALDNGDVALALVAIDDLVAYKVENGMDEDKARSSVKSSVTRYWKPLYKRAYKNNDTEEMKRIRYILKDSKLYGTTSDVLDTAKSWIKEKDN